MEREEERFVPVPLAVDVGMEVGEVRPHLVIRLVTSTTGLCLYVFELKRNLFFARKSLRQRSG